MPFLKQQCSDEQYKLWVPLAESGKILGAYCQTELGHGTHVGGIETTATFDKETDEFVVHSPTLSSTKFWPGALGFTCSHAIVMARLIIQGTDLGIHPFMVQVRSLVDYRPMKGIELGDIGSAATATSNYVVDHTDIEVVDQRWPTMVLIMGLPSLRTSEFQEQTSSHDTQTLTETVPTFESHFARRCCTEVCSMDASL